VLWFFVGPRHPYCRCHIEVTDLKKSTATLHSVETRPF
jgi:hypothetical protein